MAVTSWATFTMRKGKEAGALRLINAVRRQAQREQPGTLVYMVHRQTDAKGRLTRTLLFYERYRSMKALNEHLASSSWQAVVANWAQYFEGESAKVGVKFVGMERIGAFMRPGAVAAMGAQ
jgi:quinol monooxygenase YgiN